MRKEKSYNQRLPSPMVQRPVSRGILVGQDSINPPIVAPLPTPNNGENVEIVTLTLCPSFQLVECPNFPRIVRYFIYALILCKNLAAILSLKRKKREKLGKSALSLPFQNNRTELSFSVPHLPEHFSLHETLLQDLGSEPFPVNLCS